MNVVIDTNVVVSGIFFGGIPAQLLETIVDNKYRIIVTENIMFEYVDIIHRVAIKRQFPTNLSMQSLNDLISNAIVIDESSIDTPACADPDDIKFLQAAIAGKAKFLISGDKHLHDVQVYEGGRVIKPKEFCDLYRNES